MKFSQFINIKHKLVENGMINESMDSFTIKKIISENKDMINEGDALDSIMDYIKGLKALTMARSKVPSLIKQQLDAMKEAEIGKYNEEQTLKASLKGKSAEEKAKLRDKIDVKKQAIADKYDEKYEALTTKIDAEIQELEADLPDGAMTRQYNYDMSVIKAEYKEKILSELVEIGASTESELKYTKEAAIKAKENKPKPQTDEEKKSEYKLAKDSVDKLEKEFNDKYPKDKDGKWIKEPKSGDLANHQKMLLTAKEQQLKSANKEDKKQTKTLEADIESLKKQLAD